MKNINGLSIPGMEIHAHPAHSAAAIPSPEFLHEIARFLETESDDDCPDGVPGNHSRLEDGTTKWAAMSDYGDSNDQESSPQLY